MAYDEVLADRVRALVGAEPGITERRMFGGLAILRNGNMAVVIRGAGGLMIRVDPAEMPQVLAEPGAERAQMRGRRMQGWVTVAASAVDKAADLRRWVRRGMVCAAGLPPKAP